MSGSNHLADNEGTLVARIPSEIRCLIYGLMLNQAGTQHHIFCPSVSPEGNKSSEPQPRYLCSKKYDAAASDFFCGHYGCQETVDDDPTPTNNTSLGDLVSLMRVNKLIYREVSHVLYGSATFIFASLPELNAFLDRISPQLLSSIRSITFIAHLIPYTKEIRHNQTEGDFFRGPGWDNVALFKRMSNLKSLKIAFFPTCMLLISSPKWLNRVMQPLKDLPSTVSVQVSLPSLYLYKRGIEGEFGIPVLEGFDSNSAFYALTRPEMVYDHQLLKCRPYWHFCDLGIFGPLPPPPADLLPNLQDANRP